MASREVGWIAATIALAALVLPGAPSQAQSRPFRIALYAPWAGPQTADARHALALAIEAGVRDDVGAVEVVSFAKFGDFRAAVAGGRVDLAVIDAAVANELGERVAVRASWSSGQAWLLAGARAIDRPRTAALALQAPDAPSSRWLADRLLRGQTRGRYWARIVGAPVTADAHELVDRGKADLVLVRRGDAGALQTVADVGTFSELALVSVGSPGAVDRAAAATQSIVRARLGGDWSAGSPSFPATVGATKFAAAEPTAPLPPLSAWLRPAAAASSVDVAELWMEPDAR